ncbi:MAG TPA: hypothetical protein PKD91_06580, partial [Bacteroidia bacterium]|nr:hypothetical protein [Bacteroidia bacterium]
PAFRQSSTTNPEPVIIRSDDHLLPAIQELNAVLNELRAKGVQGVWEHRRFTEGLSDIEEIQSRARF